MLSKRPNKPFRKRVITCGLIIILAFIVVVAGSINLFGVLNLFNLYREQGPLTLTEAQAKWPLPLYIVAPDASGTSLTPIYFLQDRGDEAQLTMYFTVKQAKQITSPAILIQYTPSHGPPLEGMHEPVSILWASNEQGFTCKQLGTFANQTPIAPGTYNSCLYWQSEDNLWYVFHSIWTTDEAVKFVNTRLIKAKP